MYNNLIKYLILIIISIVTNIILCNESISAFKTYSTNDKICDYLMVHCLCKNNHYTNTYLLFCNDIRLKKVPNFKEIYYLANKTRVYFQLLDFRHSSVKKLYKTNFNYLFMNTNYENARNSNLLIYSDYYYNLEFENIEDIEDFTFKNFSLINKFNSKHVELSIKFNNISLSFGSLRKPFYGLYVKELYLNTLQSEFLYNNIFDGSSINSLFIEHSPNFIGFFDTHEPLLVTLTGLMYGYHVINSYKTSTLCSHSLPTFINHESFSQIIITKCKTLTYIKSFTFYKYRHLKKLVLTINNFTYIDVDSFRNLNELLVLDLSSNPLSHIPDYAFNDLISLKSLFIQNTNIKSISQFIFKGLNRLEELSLLNSKNLEFIHKNSFSDLKAKLKYLDLKNANISLIDYNLNLDWFIGFNLTQINVNFVNENKSNFSFQKNLNLTCKLIRSIPNTTFFNLKRSTQCSCYIYWLYRAKSFLNDNWLYKTPDCYGIQMKKMPHTILNNEKLCNFSYYMNLCSPKRINKTLTTTSIILNTTLARTTTSFIKSTTIATTRSTNSKTTILKKHLSTPVYSSRKFRNLDMKKLFYVLSTIIGISIFAILMTIFGLRLQTVMQQRTKLAANRRRQQRLSSIMCSNQRASVKILESPSNTIETVNILSSKRSIRNSNGMSANNEIEFSASKHLI